MSIAVSAIVRPSRALRALLAAYGLANFAAACAVGLGMPARFQMAPGVAIVLACAGAALLHRATGPIKTRRIDISGVGQLRLTVQQDMRMDGEGAPATLLSGSTVWPWLMLLRLGVDDGGRLLVAVLPDSVSPGAFRALAVAVRAVAEHNKPLQARHKIL